MSKDFMAGRNVRVLEGWGDRGAKSRTLAWPLDILSSLAYPTEKISRIRTKSFLLLHVNHNPRYNESNTTFFRDFL